MIFLVGICCADLRQEPELPGGAGEADDVLQGEVDDAHGVDDLFKMFHK